MCLSPPGFVLSSVERLNCCVLASQSKQGLGQSWPGFAVLSPNVVSSQASDEPRIMLEPSWSHSFWGEVGV